jgi:RNA polymerase sigma factor (sigma-70 family)
LALAGQVDTQVFVRAIETHGSRLQRLAGRIAPPGVEADDLLQETFERAWRSRETFRAEANVGTWLHSILVNRARDHTRTWVRVRDGAAERIGSEARLLDLSVGDPAQVVTRAERERELRAALAKLPMPERAAVALHDGEGFRASEVARLLGCSDDAAHKRIQRGRFRLARVLDGAEEGPRPPLGCVSARRSASAYLDGELPADQAREVEQHLSGCEHCPPVIQAIVGIRGALSAAPTQSLPPPTLERLRRAVRLEANAPG